MVIFTCSSCGDSLKKKATRIHLEFKCKSAKYITCVDCGKDFWGEDYILHTSCITEDEKYGRSGAILKVLKGEKKQDEWIKAINCCIANNRNIDPMLHKLLKQIAVYKNVPKKEKKFKNFVMNSLHTNPEIATKAWKILSQAKQPCIRNEEDSVDGENGNREEGNACLKKRESSHAEDGGKAQDEKHMTKKRKHGSSQGDNNHVCTIKRKRQRIYEVHERNLETKRMKKYREKTDGTCDIEIAGSLPCVNDKKNAFHKGKKNKICNMTFEKVCASENHDVVECGNNSDQVSTLDAVDKRYFNCNKVATKFDWTSEIKTVLKCVSESGMKVKKLEKIVVGQFLSSHDTSSKDDAKALFRDKISHGKYVISGKRIRFKS